MKIDFHTHIFPDPVRHNRSGYFAGEPAFRLLYEPEKSKMASAEELIACLDESGVDMAVTFGFPWENPDLALAHNDYIIEAQRRYPGRLAGFCCLDMYGGDPAAEVERCLDAGLYGVGELAFYQSGIDAEAVRRLAPVMAVCRERGKPVMIHTNEPVGHPYPGKTPITVRQIYDLAAAFPDNRIVLAHWGGGVFFYNLLKREAREVLKNVWYDTAASPYLYEADIYRIAGGLAGPDKILWGTDFPLLKPARYFKEMDQAGLSGPDRDALLGGNAAAFLGLSRET
ncbi:MAG: amidohydrolase family protein [Thermodesulfobacteriota bacterium]